MEKKGGNSIFLSSQKPLPVLTVGILLPRLDPYDAVGVDALAMYQILKSRGHRVYIFAEGWHRSFKNVIHCRSIDAYLNREGDILIYHHAIAWERGLGIYRRLPCKKVLRYHNITPHYFFSQYHEGIAASCKVGRMQTVQLVEAGMNFSLPCSSFNEEDLKASESYSMVRSHVLPPFNRVHEIQSSSLNLGMVSRYGMTLPQNCINVLFVGRMVPNKGIIELIRAFAVLRKLDPRYRLILLGKRLPELGLFNQELDDEIKRLAISNSIVFQQSVSDSALKSLMLSSHALVTLSQHEGFCLPVIEAMSLGVPVLALKSSALIETVGDGGVLLETSEANYVAENIKKITESIQQSRMLARKGETRFQKYYSFERLQDTFLRAMHTLSNTGEKF